MEFNETDKQLKKLVVKVGPLTQKFVVIKRADKNSNQYRDVPTTILNVYRKSKEAKTLENNVNISNEFQQRIPNWN